MPSFRHEKRCAEAGAIRIAGIDEVGRGPLAGPVVAAGAVIDPTGAKGKPLRLIDDSQTLSPAARRALQAMPDQPDLVLIDGNQVPPELGCRAETIVGGDARSYSIAAASIIAKVTRDRYMRGLAGWVPGYGWETNVGYARPEHLAALNRLGVTAHHRRSFAPGRKVIYPTPPLEDTLRALT